MRQGSCFRFHVPSRSPSRLRDTSAPTERCCQRSNCNSAIEMPSTERYYTRALGRQALSLPSSCRTFAPQRTLVCHPHEFPLFLLGPAVYTVLAQTFCPVVSFFSLFSLLLSNGRNAITKPDVTRQGDKGNKTVTGAHPDSFPFLA